MENLFRPVGLDRLSANYYYQRLLKRPGPIAQLVELPAHNRLVPGSSPGGPTILREITHEETANFSSRPEFSSRGA